MAKKYYLYVLFSVQSQVFTESSDIFAGETKVESGLASLLILQDFVMIYITRGDSEFRKNPNGSCPGFGTPVSFFVPFHCLSSGYFFTVRSSYFTHCFSVISH